MTTDAFSIQFSVAASLIGGNTPMWNEIKRAIESAEQFRYTVVALSSDGGLPAQAEITAHNSANTVDEAREIQAWFASNTKESKVFAGNTLDSEFAIIDRAENIMVANEGIDGFEGR